MDDKTIGTARISPERRHLAQVILDVAAFSQRLGAFAEKLLETTGDDRGSLLLAAASELESAFIPAAHDIVLGLRARAASKEPKP